MKFIPIKDIIKDVESLSANPDKNKKKLNYYSNILKNQKDLFSKISTNKIKKKIDNSDLSFEEYSNYKDILTEKKNLVKYDNVINNIINKDYDSVYIRRQLRRKKMIAVVAAGTILVVLGGIGLKKNSNKQNNDIISNEVTTEITTEMTTEATTEVTTETNYEELTRHAEENYNKYKEYSNETIDEETGETLTTEATTEVTTEATTEATTETTGIQENQINEKLVDVYNKTGGYINTLEDTLMDEDKRNEAKENAKSMVTKYVDFIFYGSEINGVTFDELKDDEKNKIYEQLKKLDTVISNEDPDYKENLGERYNRIKDFGATTLNKAKEKIKEKVGEDYYNDAGQIKEDTVDTIKDTGKILKNIFKNKYNEWKNKDNE